VVTQNAEAQEWSGISVYPCDTWEAETLAADERIQATLQGIARDHTVTVLDTFPTNPLWKFAIEMATDVIVVATPRPDALAQAEVVLRRLTEETSALDPKPRIHLVLNQVQTLGERISITGQASAWIKFDPRRADKLDSILAVPLLELLYPGWKKQGKTA
jgi:MinD-like ATPase involved in chromosome partitioning or flagellar assembly